MDKIRSIGLLIMACFQRYPNKIYLDLEAITLLAVIDGITLEYVTNPNQKEFSKVHAYLTKNDAR